MLTIFFLFRMESIFPFAWIFSACRRRHSVAISACRERDSKGALLLWWDARAKPLDGPGGRTNNPADDLFRSFCGCRARVARVKPCRGIQGGGAHLASLGRCGAASGAKWLAILRNLPDIPEPIWTLRRSAAGWLWFCDLPARKTANGRIEEEGRPGEPGTPRRFCQVSGRRKSPVNCFSDPEQSAV